MLAEPEMSPKVRTRRGGSFLALGCFFLLVPPVRHRHVVRAVDDRRTVSLWATA